MQRIVWAAVVIVLGGGVAAYYFMRDEAPPAPPPPPQQTIPRSPAPPAVVAPAIRHPLRGVGATALPELNASDAPMWQALGELLGRKGLDFIIGDGLIHRIVATADNLPRDRLPVGVMPLKRVPKAFVTAGKGDTLAIGARNSARYAAYARLVGAIDATPLVAIYVRFYPLFQRAYEDMGFPNAYFNDRLVQAIDDLLAAPDVSGPIKLVQPMVLYEFADPKLEARSAGQKIMIRIGREHSVTVKTKLREIRRLVASDAAG